LGKSAALPNIQNIGVKNHDVGLRKLSPTYGVAMKVPTFIVQGDAADMTG